MHPEPTADAYVPLRRRDGTVHAWVKIDAADLASVTQDVAPPNVLQCEGCGEALPTNLNYEGSRHR